MKGSWQLPRLALTWLLGAQCLVIAPHTPRLTWPVLALCAACIGWRVMVHTGRWRYPRWPVKAAMVLGILVGIGATYRPIYGLEPAIALLVATYCMKLLETHSTSDACLVAYLGFFVIGTQFLFLTNIATSAYVLGVMVVIVCALVAISQSRWRRSWSEPLKLAGRMMLQALPLMLVLFIFFPRIAPLWTVPLQSSSGITGISDVITPGDVAELGRSDELAFRVTFDGERPPRPSWYWRGLTYGHFDGRTWQVASPRTPASRRVRVAGIGAARADQAIAAMSNPVAYDVVIEPTLQRWLFGLGIPTSQTEDVGFAADLRLIARYPLHAKTYYRVTSWLDGPVEPDPPDFMLNQGLQLPGPDANPRTLAFATDLRARSASDVDYARRVMRHYFDAEFVYTLSPGALAPENTIDQFLFDTRRGFCSHFAGSFVYLMRAAGIPARMVGGYQGGELNPLTGHVSVRQYDAHAWAEIWIEGQGWLRYDPTAMVSPARIEQGLEAAMAAEGSFLEGQPFSPYRWRDFALVADILLRLDSLEHQWNLWVVGYDTTVQSSTIRDWFGDGALERLGWLLGGVFAAVFSVIAAFLLYGSRARRPREAVRLYREMLARLARLGIDVPQGATPDAVQRLAETCTTNGQHAVADAVGDAVAAFTVLEYAGDAADPEALRRLRDAVRRLRRTRLTDLFQLANLGSR